MTTTGYRFDLHLYGHTPDTVRIPTVAHFTIMDLLLTLISRLSPKDPELSRADVFDLVSNKRRRGVIHYLRETDQREIPLDDVIEAVVSWESDDRPTDITESQRASVYSSLVQTHLPRLEEHGVVIHHTDEGTVEPTELAREVELYLEYSPKAEIPWAEYYLGLGAVCAALIAVVWAELPPFDALDGIVVAGIVVGLLLLSATVHLFQTRRGRLGSEWFERDLGR